VTTTGDPREQRAEHRIVFVKLPQAIDVTNHRIVLDTLAAALAERPSVVVADGSATGFCDCAGVSALVCAHRLVAAAGAQLRLVTAGVRVRRIIKLVAAHDVLNTYLNMGEALADMTDPQQCPSSADSALTPETEEPDVQSEQPDQKRPAGRG